jgi:hypothetical protein
MQIVNRPFSSKDDTVTVEEISVTYAQDADTNSDCDEGQLIKLTTQYAESLNIEFPYYINIEIPEGHWSINDSDELLQLINDFKERVTKKFK